jgi:hypothetical protein
MSAGGRGRVTLAVVLAVVGGLSVAGGTAAAWVRLEEQREIGGVPVAEVEAVGGLELAPALLPVGLVAAIAGLALLAARGRLQQAVAALVLLAGVASAALLAAGLAETPPEGTLAAGPAFSGLGALALAAAGGLGLRPASPATLPARYDLDAEEGDDEWRLASAEDDEWPLAGTEDDDAP